MCTFVRRKVGYVSAEQLDLSRTRPQVAADLMEQGGLAGAVRTDDQASFTRPYRKRYVLRHDKAAERLLQVDDLERMAGCYRSHRDPLRNAAASLFKPGTIPVGTTRTMKRKTIPSNMFQRSR